MNPILPNVLKCASVLAWFGLAKTLAHFNTFGKIGFISSHDIKSRGAHSGKQR